MARPVGKKNTYMHTLSENAILLLKKQGLTKKDLALLCRSKDCVNNELSFCELKQHQYDALVIFCFNIGTQAFRNSATLLHIKSGNIRKALTLWRERRKSRDENDRYCEDEIMASQRDAEIEIYLFENYGVAHEPFSQQHQRSAL